MHKTNTASANDSYVTQKATDSLFRTELADMKESVIVVMKDLKDCSDKTLACIERILWPLVGKHPRPKEAFGKSARTNMVKSKLLLADGVRIMNDAICGFVAAEKAAKVEWVAGHLASIRTADAGCQTETDSRPSPTELRLAEQLREANAHMRDADERSAAAQRRLTLERDSAVLSLRYLQEKLVELHRDLYTSLHLVFKHRFKWISRHVDPLKAFLRSKAARAHERVEFNLGLGGVLDEDREQLKRFGDYFTRDDCFGVDMTARCVPVLCLFSAFQAHATLPPSRPTPPANKHPRSDNASSDPARGSASVSWRAGGRKKESYARRLSLPTASAGALLRVSTTTADADVEAPAPHSADADAAQAAGSTPPDGARTPVPPSTPTSTSPRRRGAAKGPVPRVASQLALQRRQTVPSMTRPRSASSATWCPPDGYAPLPTTVVPAPVSSATADRTWFNPSAQQARAATPQQETSANGRRNKGWVAQPRGSVVLREDGTHSVVPRV